MNLGLTLLNTFVVVAVGAALTYLTNDRFKILRTEFHRDIEALRHEVNGLRQEFKADLAEVKSDVVRVEGRLDAGIAAVRSDIVQVALAVGAKRSASQG